MKRIFVIGGGITGLVCANVFKKYGADVVVYEQNTLGGEFLTGGLRYIHHTIAMEKFMEDMEQIWTDYRIKGGILLKGKVEKYPSYLSEMPKDEAYRIRCDHFKKTRLMMPGDFGAQGMNDPSSTKPSTALRCDFESFIKNMASRVKVVKAGLIKIIGNKAFFNNSTVGNFDYIVLTIPLWVVNGIVDFEIPDAVAMKLNIAIVNGAKILYSKSDGSTALRDPYLGWDYIYTPYTPSDCIHRISYSDDGYAVEFNGDYDGERLYSDLNFLFKDGWEMVRIRKNLRGHLLPLDGKLKLPENMALLGRFAAWEPRMTVDVVLDKSIELSKRWLRG